VLEKMLISDTRGSNTTCCFTQMFYIVASEEGKAGVIYRKHHLENV